MLADRSQHCLRIDGYKCKTKAPVIILFLVFIRPRFVTSLFLVFSFLLFVGDKDE